MIFNGSFVGQFVCNAEIYEQIYIHTNAHINWFCAINFRIKAASVRIRQFNRAILLDLCAVCTCVLNSEHNNNGMPMNHFDRENPRSFELWH